jgi:hypothetical protein
VISTHGIFMHNSVITAGTPMVCLFHGDYGPADPAFNIDAGSASGGRGWAVDANLLKAARNIGEVEAVQRHALRGEPISWCDQGYAWVEQDAIGWFYAAAFLLVVLPYLIMKVKSWGKGASDEVKRAGHQGLTR